MKYKCRRVLASDSKQEEMMIDVEELKSVLEGYKKSFENRWEDEKFKWEEYNIWPLNCALRY